MSTLQKLLIKCVDKRYTWASKTFSKKVEFYY